MLRPNVGRPERATKTRLGQKEPRRLGSTICYGQEKKPLGNTERATKTRQYDLLRRPKEPPSRARKEPPRRLGSRQYDLLRPKTRKIWARKSHQDSAVRFVTAKRGPERATKTRQYDLLRPRIGQKEPPRLGSTICYGQSHRDSARFVTAKSWPERATKTSTICDGQTKKEPPRLGSTICYGQSWPEKASSAVRFVTAK